MGKRRIDKIEKMANEKQKEKMASEQQNIELKSIPGPRVWKIVSKKKKSSQPQKNEFTF